MQAKYGLSLQWLMAHFLGLTIPLRVLSCSQDACSITDPVACSKSLAQQGLASVLHPDSHAVQGDHLVCECYVYFVLCVCVCPFMWHCHRQVLGKGSACKPWARHPDATTHPTQSRFFGVGGGGGGGRKKRKHCTGHSGTRRYSGKMQGMGLGPGIGPGSGLLEKGYNTSTCSVRAAGHEFALPPPFRGRVSQ